MVHPPLEGAWARAAVSRGAWPTFLVVGGMKCGTTSLHRYLGRHPEVCTSEPKELDFFFGDEPGGRGNGWRGDAWYTGHFDGERPVRGESSPGYTSPDRPEVAARIAERLPDVRIVYLARTPLERAVSQYLHHRRDGTEERPLGEALLDPDSQYIARSRHAERLAPYLDVFPRERILLVRNEALGERPREVVAAVLTFLGADPDAGLPDVGARHNAARQDHPQVPPEVRARFQDAIGDDPMRLQAVVASGPSVE